MGTTVSMARMRKKEKTGGRRMRRRMLINTSNIQWLEKSKIMDFILTNLTGLLH
jgi:hypothetical protein